MRPSKWYTRIIAIFFILVTITLIIDLIKVGFNPESMHKIFHILLGLIVLMYGWNSKQWWKTFPLVSGLFFSYVALFGILFPNFASLDAFNTLDTTLHAIVGLSGITIALLEKKANSL